MSQPNALVIGAGPAGMSAAIALAENGASVVVLDEQPQPGGQIYRAIQSQNQSGLILLGDDYRYGLALVNRFSEAVDAGKITYHPRSTVWRTEPECKVCYSVSGKAFAIQSDYLILATGALERPVPVPGWTLPGVMTVGAAQILLKAQRLVACDAVLVGSGPLLYLLAAQMIDAGSPPKALLETQTLRRYVAATQHLPGALMGWRTVKKGLSLLAKIRRAGVQRYIGVKKVSIEGGSEVTGIRFTVGNRDLQLAASLILLHQGVVPNTQISRSLNLMHRWHDGQRCFQPILDDFGASSNARISVAGDGGEISGAIAATIKGEIVALAVLVKVGVLGKVQSQIRAERLHARLRTEIAPRAFLDSLYMPPAAWFNPPDNCVVCRCEEVTAGDIRRYVRVGCTGPNQTKALGRCGMGPCQGRYCGLTVTEILAAENGLTHDEVGSYRIRSPLKPITLGELASMEMPKQ